jgi:hypothetical protein
MRHLAFAGAILLACILPALAQQQDMTKIESWLEMQRNQAMDSFANCAAGNARLSARGDDLTKQIVDLQAQIAKLTKQIADAPINNGDSEK